MLWKRLPKNLNEPSQSSQQKLLCLELCKFWQQSPQLLFPTKTPMTHCSLVIDTLFALIRGYELEKAPWRQLLRSHDPQRYILQQLTDNSLHDKCSTVLSEDLTQIHNLVHEQIINCLFHINHKCGCLDSSCGCGSQLPHQSVPLEAELLYEPPYEPP